MLGSDSLPPGTAPVKAEYLISRGVVQEFDDDAAEGKTNPANPESKDTPKDEETGEPPVKRQRLTGAQKRKIAREEGKKTRGQNKGRRWQKVHDEIELCWQVARGDTCTRAECKFSHDIKAYLAVKPPDIRFPKPEDIAARAPFVLGCDDAPEAEDSAETSLESTTICPVFRELGVCQHGFKCRFLSDHVKRREDVTRDTGIEVELVRNEEKAARMLESSQELNRLSNPLLMKLLRTRKYPTPKSEEYLSQLASARDVVQVDEVNGDETVLVEPSEANGAVDINPEATAAAGPSYNIFKSQTIHEEPDGSQDVPFRPVEKKRLNWKDKTYLAPLTTVGNLPFRRLCVRYGADITCGEMGLATSFLNGSKEEWSLVRRHPSESIFGVQVAGNKPVTLVTAAEIIGKECPDIDFLDVNCGCPIDLVYKNGAGSALLDSVGKLGKIVMGLNRVLDIPVTIKLRTGVKEGRNTVHRIMPRLQGWGVGAVTIHGRTRQQRYTKLADWGYIKQCVDTLRSASADEDLPPIPIFGGGDAFSAQGYYESMETSGVDGVMIGRGALIKPWIFTEIKERREWDISSRERLDMVRQLCEFGLSHWGTDTAGVNTTRRYVCEALSFQHRYVPIGLLERLPGRMNDRAPAFRGRDELETLLASSESRKWVEISSMFLGAPPEDWTFAPKHRSNAVSDEANG